MWQNYSSYYSHDAAIKSSTSDSSWVSQMVSVVHKYIRDIAMLSSRQDSDFSSLV